MPNHTINKATDGVFVGLYDKQEVWGAGGGGGGGNKPNNFYKTLYRTDLLLYNAYSNVLRH